MALTQTHRTAEIITPLGKDILLLSNVNITEEMGRLFHIEAELFSEQENIKFEDLLGKSITIRLNFADASPRFFNGHATDFTQIDRRDSFGGGVYRMTVQPWLWLLTRTADCKIFQAMSVPEIIKEVCGGYDLEDRLTRNYRTWEYCVQYRETDFNFVSRLMEQEGIYYYFEHQEGAHKLILADDYSAHQAIKTNNGRVPLMIPGEGSLREEEFCTDWATSKSILPGKYALNDYDFERPRANLQVNTNLAKPHAVGSEEIYDYPGEYIEIDDGNQYSKTRIEELHARYETSQARSSVRGMTAGGLFKLEEHPRKDHNKEYLLTAVNHRFQNETYGAGSSGASGEYLNDFQAIDSKTPFRSSQNTPKPIVQGPQTAVVVGPAGEEIYTDKYSRVKVQFHWDRYGRKDENSSCWVRVSQLWAGKNWGGIHIPRIGQEVIVDFLEGDPDNPIITGRVYNAEQMPPYDLPANKTQSGIKSRSSKGGSSSNFNEIRMEDKKGQEQLYVHAEKNQDNIVENDETTSVGHDRTEDVGNDETINIGRDRTETVGNNEKITIGNDRTELVVSNESITIGKNRRENVGDNESITIGKNRSEQVALNETITIGKNRKENVGDNEAITIGKNRTEQVGKDESITIGKNRSESVGDNESINIGKNQNIQVGKNITIEAGDQIVIRTGKSSITMKKDGSIRISGKDITVNGSGKIDVKASKNITMKGQKILQN
ncbi:MAG: type VI secretion system Vgr family protein [Thiolinea sp.]